MIIHVEQSQKARVTAMALGPRLPAARSSWVSGIGFILDPDRQSESES